MDLFNDLNKGEEKRNVSNWFFQIFLKILTSIEWFKMSGVQKVLEIAWPKFHTYKVHYTQTLSIFNLNISA